MFDSDVAHHAGVKHQVTNAPSRVQRTGDGDKPLDDDLPLLATNATNRNNDILVNSTKSDKINQPNAQE